MAHDFTLGISYELEKDQGRTLTLSHLAELTAQIAEGDRIVALIMQIENGDPLPAAAHFDSYVRRAVSWVCEVSGRGDR